MKKVAFKTYDEAELQCYLYEPKEKVKGVVQIIHGMQEHAQRYDNFAKFLSGAGFVVWTSDLRGHGASAEFPDYLGFTTGDITKDNLLDQIAISEHLKVTYPDLPLTVIGHSYGSFILQHHIAQCDLADKIVLSGSAYTNTFLMKSAKILASVTMFFKGKKARAKLIEKASLKSYAKKFEGGNWLSRDNRVWEKYKHDPLCGTPFPAKFYKSMSGLITKNYCNIAQINKNMPMLLLGGSNDPVSNNGKLLLKLYKVYQRQHLRVQLKFYVDARHEILNETNNKEVYNDILEFIKK